VVVLEYKIYVYNFADLNLLHTIETASNPRGLCSLCPDSRACVLACPGLQKGHVKVEPHGQGARLSSAQLGPCASSGRAWRLWAARHSQGGAGRPTGRPATASGARASCLQSRRCHRL
jgi:hypothetical protein